MKIKITKAGIYGAKGKPYKVGAELTVKSIPKGWKDKVAVIAEDDENTAKTAVTNPAKANASTTAIKG